MLLLIMPYVSVNMLTRSIQRCNQGVQPRIQQQLDMCNPQSAICLFHYLPCHHTSLTYILPYSHMQIYTGTDVCQYDCMRPILSIN